MGPIRRAGLLLGLTLFFCAPLPPAAASGAEGPDADATQDLASTDGNARRRAVEQLGRSGRADAVPLLLGAYEAETADAFGVKAAVATALGGLGVPDAAAPLARILADPDYWVRRKAAEALGKVPGEAATRALSEALADRDVRVRAEAVRSLGSRRGEGGRARAALDDPDPRVVTAALEALDASQAPEATQALAKALSHGAREVRYRAASLLARRGDPRGLQALAGGMRSADDTRLALREAGLAGCSAVPLVTELLAQTPGDEQRDLLVGLLEAQSCGAATDALVEEALCRSCAPATRVRAAQALFGRRQDLSVAQARRTAGLLAESDPDLLALGLQILLDAAATPDVGRLSALAAHDNQVVRHFALAGLGKFGGPEQEGVLVKALGDANGSNIRLALEALARFGSAGALPSIHPLAEDRLYRRAAEAAVEAIEARRP